MTTPLTEERLAEIEGRNGFGGGATTWVLSCRSCGNTLHNRHWARCKYLGPDDQFVLDRHCDWPPPATPANQPNGEWQRLIDEAEDLSHDTLAGRATMRVMIIRLIEAMRGPAHPQSKEGV